MNPKEWAKRKGKKTIEKNIDRQIEAYKLRFEEGKTYNQIANLLGYNSPTAAYYAVQSAIKYHLKNRIKTLEEARDNAIARMTQYIEDLRSKIINDKQVLLEEDQLKVYDRIFKAEGMIAKLQGINIEKPNINVNISNHEERLKELE